MKSWYIIYSKPKEERIAQEQLGRQGYETYLPLVMARVKQRGRNKKTIQPMFPRYLFIFLSDQTDDWGPIRSTIGVSSLVKFGVNPAKVPIEVITKLKESEEDKGFHEITNFDLKSGDDLIVAEGPFEGYEAIFLCQNADDRVAVLLKIAEKHIKLVLDQSLIEKTGHSSI